MSNGPNDFLDSHQRAEAVADNYELEQPPAFVGTADELIAHVQSADDNCTCDSCYRRRFDESMAASQPAAESDALDALEAMACAFGKELDAGHSTLPQQRAWRFAKCVLVEAGRRVR